MTSVYNKVRAQFARMTSVITSWAQWRQSTAPNSDDVDEYVAGHPLHIPFQSTAFSDDYSIPTDQSFFSEPTVAEFQALRGQMMAGASVHIRHAKCLCCIADRSRSKRTYPPLIPIVNRDGVLCQDVAAGEAMQKRKVLTLLLYIIY
jgi:hypothetical protein